MAKKKRKRSKSTKSDKLENQQIRTGEGADSTNNSGDEENAPIPLAEGSDSPAADDRSIEEIRSQVTAVVQKLLDKESATQDQLKRLEKKLKPLNQSVAELKERVNLDQQHIIDLWKKGKQSSLDMAERIDEQHQRDVKQRLRCEAIEIAMVRQCHSLDVHTVQPSQLWEEQVKDEFAAFIELEKEVLGWLAKGEYRYLGIAPPEPEESPTDQVQEEESFETSTEPSSALETSAIVDEIESVSSKPQDPNVFDVDAPLVDPEPERGEGEE